MDINDLRNLVTVLSFAMFAAIAAWAWSRRNKTRFEEAEQLPFLDDGQPVSSPEGDRHE